MFLLFLVLPCCALFNTVMSLSNHPILIVISYDAFRYDFFKKNATPNLAKLREKGTYAPYLMNVFPTKTFPNHHSIATGLYTNKHGVVGNSFYDAATKEVVYYSYDLFHYDESVVPIWTLNEDAGHGRYSGSMMWPGGSFPYQDKLPSYAQEFEDGFDWYKRVDTVLSWIENPEKPANLVMLYFEEPDTHGHIYGPDSETTFDLLKRLDNISLYLQKELQSKGLEDKVNIIHLSDHGMTTVTRPRFIDLTKFLPSDSYYKLAGSSPCLHFIPDEGFEDEYYGFLKNASITNGHFKVYKKDKIPSRWNFKDSPRAPPILILADEGYGFQDLFTLVKKYEKNYDSNVTDNSPFGVHGYDPQVASMHPFFMARGPRIKVNHTVPPFNTVDLFDLFTEILNIPTIENDGCLDNIRDILKEDRTQLLPLVTLIIGGGLLVLLLIVCAAVVTLIIIKRQQNITTTAALNKRFPQTFNHSKIEAQHLLEYEDA